MIRYGTQAQNTRPMTVDDIFISRLVLLIIMVKAYIKGFPIGDFRKSAIRKNAGRVFSEAFSRSGQNLPESFIVSSPDTTDNDKTIPDQLFLQRVQLLAVMANAFAQGKAVGNYRKRAMSENIAHISEFLSNRIQPADAQFLKVA